MLELGLRQRGIGISPMRVNQLSATGDRIIFVGVPETQIIGRIDSQHAVIAPASAGMGLVASASSQLRLRPDRDYSTDRKPACPA